MQNIPPKTKLKEKGVCGSTEVRPAGRQSSVLSNEISFINVENQLVWAGGAGKSPAALLPTQRWGCLSARRRAHHVNKAIQKLTALRSVAMSLLPPIICVKKKKNPGLMCTLVSRTFRFLLPNERVTHPSAPGARSALTLGLRPGLSTHWSPLSPGAGSVTDNAYFRRNPLKPETEATEL